MDLVFLLTLAGMVGAACLAQSSQETTKRRNAWVERAQASWKRAASLVGGHFKMSSGRWSEPRMQITVLLEHVTLLVDNHAESDPASTTVTTTRIVGSANNPPGLRLSVHGQGLPPNLGNALRLRDVDVGDPALDGSFVVQASNQQLARLWLTPNIREALRATSMYALTLDAHRLTSIRVGLEEDPAQLASAIRAAALVAGRGRMLTKEWKTLAQELGGSLSTREGTLSEGEMSIGIEHRGGLISVQFGRSGQTRRFGTQVRADRIASPSERFTVQRRAGGILDPTEEVANPFGDEAFSRVYGLQASAPEKVTRRFTEELRHEIVALRPWGITGDEAAVTMVFRRLEMRRERIERAIGIVSALAAPGAHGPYR